MLCHREKIDNNNVFGMLHGTLKSVLKTPSDRFNLTILKKTVKKVLVLKKEIEQDVIGSRCSSSRSRSRSRSTSPVTTTTATISTLILDLKSKKRLAALAILVELELSTMDSVRSDLFDQVFRPDPDNFVFDRKNSSNCTMNSFGGDIFEGIAAETYRLAKHVVSDGFPHVMA